MEFYQVGIGAGVLIIGLALMAIGKGMKERKNDRDA
jgi:hypothetical protein